MLVFFDDILVYSKPYSNHLKHLRIVLDTLNRHILFAKMSKCRFGVAKVDYLGYHLLVKVASSHFLQIFERICWTHWLL